MEVQSLLRDNDLKVTPQRLAILNHLKDAGHSSIDEIYGSVRSLFPSVSLGTVYKNLTDMSELGILAEVKIPKQKQKYEISKEPHVHLVCEACGKICDFDINIDSIVDRVQKSSRYEIKDRSAVFTGTCPECKKVS